MGVPIDFWNNETMMIKTHINYRKGGTDEAIYDDGTNTITNIIPTIIVITRTEN